MAKQSAEKRAVGRPPKGETKDKRKALSTRITESLRDKLDRAADDSGRSLSQEIEFRLEQSFSDEDARTEQLHKEFGGSHTYALAKLIGRLAHDLEVMSGAEWTNDSYVFDQLISGMEEVMTHLRPSDELRRADSRDDALERGMLKEIPPEYRAILGKARARGWLENVQQSQKYPEEKEDVHFSNQLRIEYELGPILGPLLIRSAKSGMAR